MDTLARQAILPPPPSSSRAFVAFLCAHQARLAGFVRGTMERLARRSTPMLESPCSELPSAPGWAEPDKVASMLAALRAQDSGLTPPYQLASAIRQRSSACTAVEMRRAG